MRGRGHDARQRRGHVTARVGLAGADGRVWLRSAVRLEEQVIGVCGIRGEHGRRGPALAVVKGAGKDKVVGAVERGRVLVVDGLGGDGNGRSRRGLGGLGRLAGGCALGDLVRGARGARGAGDGCLVGLAVVRRTSAALEVFQAALELLACEGMLVVLRFASVAHSEARHKVKVCWVAAERRDMLRLARTVVALSNAVLDPAALGQVGDLGPVLVGQGRGAKGAAGAVGRVLSGSGLLGHSVHVRLLLRHGVDRHVVYVKVGWWVRERVGDGEGAVVLWQKCGQE